MGRRIRRLLTAAGSLLRFNTLILTSGKFMPAASCSIGRDRKTSCFGKRGERNARPVQELFCLVLLPVPEQKLRRLARDFVPGQGLKAQECFAYPQRACPHPYGSFVANGYDIFPIFRTVGLAEKNRRPRSGFYSEVPCIFEASQSFAPAGAK